MGTSRGFAARCRAGGLAGRWGRGRLGWGCDVDAGAVGQDGDVRDLGLRQVGGLEHAERGRVGGRGGRVETRIRREGQLDRGATERAAGDPWIGILHVAAEQGGRLGLGGRVEAVGADQVPRELGRARAEGRFELTADPGGLLLDVQAGQDERHGVAVATRSIDADLGGGGRELTPYAE